MLSFNGGEDDLAIAYGYGNPECAGAPMFTVYFIPDYHSEPAIESSDPKGGRERALSSPDRVRVIRARI